MSRWKKLAIVAIILGAWWLRTHQLASLPVGAHYDEAANGVITADIAWRGYRPIFIESYTGKEVFFFYTTALIARLLNTSLFALRLTSAIIGTLTVALTIRLTRTIAPRTTHWPLLAGATIALFFPHILLSRLGFRAISQPLWQAVTLILLWQAIRLRRWPLFLAAGIALGGTAYTYLAVRLFPLLLTIPLIGLFWQGDRRQKRHLALYLCIALLTSSPLLFYFWQHPARFWVRIGQISADHHLTNAYLDGLRQSLAMFFWQGDPYIRFNWPLRPQFLPIGALSLLLGYGVLLSRRTATCFVPFGRLTLLLAPLIMLLPTALAVNEITPSNLRAIGTIPFTAIIASYPWAHWLDNHPSRRIRLTLPFFFFAFMLWRFAEYRQWATHPDLFTASDADLVAISADIDQYQGEAQTFLSALHYRHPTVAFTSQRYAQLKWLVGGQAWVQPEDRPARFYFPLSAPPPDWWREQWGEPLKIGRTDDNRPIYTVYETEPKDEFSLDQSLDFYFGEILHLEGYELHEKEGVATILLAWRVLSPSADNWMPFVHILDLGGFRWAEGDSDAYFSEQWQAGERVVLAMELPLAEGMIAGEYTLNIGFYAGEKRLALVDEFGRFAGDGVRVTTSLQGNNTATLTPPYRVGEKMGSVTLLGYERGDTAETGSSFWLNLWWQKDDDFPLSADVVLIAPDGTERLWFPVTAPAQSGFLRQHLYPIIPLDLATGQYMVQLRPREAPPISLGMVAVVATERLFTAPPITHPLSAEFGEELRLLGYNLTTGENGVSQLELVWQANRVPSADYTLFLHVVGADGVCCAWQGDAAPARPTSRWVAEEVVVDRREIDLSALPSGSYEVRLGFYLPSNGQRLRVGESADSFTLPQPIGR